ncbi:ankyrin repeat domain-containing protein [Streptomyces aureocirculatus]|uniref:ankyrin repeat domain-containing protein n=1 Tax=Streptomyces aureocirculatus TaxID=67275 RepID=UPI001CEC700D|nr:ankyrin repeat domain-containing protein [Streptomyces aureocirculatus]
MPYVRLSFQPPLNMISVTLPMQEKGTRWVSATRHEPKAQTWCKSNTTCAGHGLCRHKRGVEGIVSRRWDNPYNPRLPRAWVKWRRTDPVDAAVLAVLGPPRRPHAVRVLLDGMPVTTSPRLTSVQAAQVARAVAGHLGAQGRMSYVPPVLAATAAEYGHPQTVDLLLRHGADINGDEGQDTP